LPETARKTRVRRKKSARAPTLPSRNPPPQALAPFPRCEEFITPQPCRGGGFSGRASFRELGLGVPSPAAPLPRPPRVAVLRTPPASAVTPARRGHETASGRDPRPWATGPDRDLRPRGAEVPPAAARRGGDRPGP